jgi:hypothetical protein
MNFVSMDMFTIKTAVQQLNTIGAYYIEVLNQRQDIRQLLRRAQQV